MARGVVDGWIAGWLAGLLTAPSVRQSAGTFSPPSGQVAFSGALPPRPLVLRTPHSNHYPRPHLHHLMGPILGTQATTVAAKEKKN
ncbi:hypothetical protein M5D96_004644 [Drosophila gunungcola]|uniref:Secreted protein n=1 Tax=Drosophila gunungcola TaxID=103775 RepID=A0A9P9YUD3_9MUSC|nr:hypothetical protein M5D96_004644 [Drosophila gunungcola]